MNRIVKMAYVLVCSTGLCFVASIIFSNLSDSTENLSKNENVSSSVNDSTTASEENDDTVEEEKSSDESSSSPDEKSDVPEDRFKDLYVNAPTQSNIENNMVYLTFDDGPSHLTEKVLDILAQEKVKATFFVIGQSDENSKRIMKRIVDEGHSIGVHTYTHDYKEIYFSLENYLADFSKVFNLIYEATGVKPDIFRFPGGSVNSFNKETYTQIVEEMTKRGFTYYDWNVSNGDCGSNYSKENCIRNVLRDSNGCNRVIALMHDAAAKKYTVEALPTIIKELKKQGFSFNRITNNVKPIQFTAR